jgi:hypothetical protein
MHETVGRIPEAEGEDRHIGAAPRHAVAAAREALQQGLPFPEMAPA